MINGSRGIPFGITHPIVGRISLSPIETPTRDSILLLEDVFSPKTINPDLAGVIVRNRSKVAISGPVAGRPTLFLSDLRLQLEMHDIVAIHTDGTLETLFRPNSRDNSLFVTDNCNCNCLMCSQPPKTCNDIQYRFAINEKLVPLIPAQTETLGITGGEPTLLGPLLSKLLSAVKGYLPNTEIQVLTNARAFSSTDAVKQIRNVEHRKVIFGIPLNSDHSSLHDYITQSSNSFAQTVTGIHNLTRYDQRIEIRVILQRPVVRRLRKLAEFIFRNMPFVEHVAFMGLEPTGNAAVHWGDICVDPSSYETELREAVELLSISGIPVSIFNLPNCVLSSDLWPFCKQSISDWKRIYDDSCSRCKVFSRCGGFFESARTIGRLKAEPVS